MLIFVLPFPGVETPGYFLSPRRGFGLRKRMRMSFRFSSAKRVGEFRSGEEGKLHESLPDEKRKLEAIASAVQKKNAPPIRHRGRVSFSAAAAQCAGVAGGVGVGVGGTGASGMVT